MSDSERTRRQYLRVVGATATVGLVGCSGTGSESPNGSPTERTTSGVSPTSETPVHPGYETTVVRVETASGERLGEVTAAIADTQTRRYTGLSETASLPEDRGMLFVYDSVGDHTFVMREMDFGIDIVYADSDGTITEIHHAPKPGPNEDGEDQRYPGRGQYVLEVNYEWTSERGVSVGDKLVFGW
ncbi:DUF192 domain-containing protein [Salinibaculum salinum]|uniref:DUF192 domain-containing protein n=1 Tax=Salinibaculum salinum TaxID=3131996 RepID=UPI0030ED65B4